MTLDRNIRPYYNDFDETKKYYEIMFRPDVSVQAREMTQLQTQLQKQIERFGSHVFKEGSMVIPGEIALDTNLPFVKLQATYSSANVNVSNFMEKRIVGVSSGATAIVLSVLDSDASDSKTLYIKYLSGTSSVLATGNISNTSTTITGLSIDATSNLIVGAKIVGSGIPANTYITEIVSATSIKISNACTATATGTTLTFSTAAKFSDNETIVTIETNSAISPVYATTETSNSTGVGSKVQLNQGVYFIGGYFCFVETQSLVLEKYNSVPSYKVGFRFVESFVTSEDDVSLNDPAGGTNTGGPGAHRYKIDLQLVKYALDTTLPDNFVELLRIENGVIKKQVTKPEYAELEKTLARRTYDESGDYTVRYFPIEIREHLDTGSNRGIYTSLNGGDESKLAIGIEPGKAYVRGYEIETIGTQYVPMNKARTSKTEQNIPSIFALGNYTGVTNLTGSFDISSFETVNLYSVNRASGSWGAGTVVGTAKVRGQEYVSGTAGTTGAVYVLYLFDVDMTSGEFSSVRSIGTSTTKAADIVLVSSKAVLYDATINNLLVSLPYSSIKSVSDYTYSVKRVSTATMVGSTVTLSATTDEIYAPYNLSNYHVSIVTPSATATGNGFSTGSVINLSDSGNSVVLSGSPLGKQVTFTIPSIAGSTIRITSTIVKTLGKQKTKTLQTNTQTLAHSSTIQLAKADVYKIVSITDVSTSENITNRYVLDNGQRDSYYDRGSLKFNSVYTAPSGNVTIVYQYFDHGAGDFFSVNSYSGVIPYKDIPLYTSPTTKQSYKLSDVVDFRPRINDAGSGFSVYSEIPVIGGAYTADIEFYTQRIDKLVLSDEGNFFVVEGVPSTNPSSPKTPDNSMCLYEIVVNPYTYSETDVSVNMVDNKRYTMRDIGKLEKRIENLEYYTTLSLLEKATSELFIDDGLGFDRFKSGFLVDNFTTLSIGNTSSAEFKCAIDTDNRLVRTQFRKDNVPLNFNTSGSSNYAKTGRLITLPYTVSPMITQKFASKTENINPFAIFSWSGGIKLTPSSDQWFDTTRIPDQIIENNVASGLESLDGATVWNDWQTNWVGTSTTLSTTVTGVSRVHTSGHRGQQIKETIDYESTVATIVGQTRTGAKLSVVTETSSQTLGDRVVSIATIPYMRSITIAFEAKNLKPNTRVYPFFDGINVSAYTKPQGSTFGSQLVTNVSGEISGEFVVPNTDTLRFRTGKRVFRLADDDSNDSNFISTFADETFESTGTLQTVQNTIISTTTSKLASTEVRDSQTTAVISTTTSQSVRYIDPIAQTFVIDSKGGAFIPRVDIYFATKDSKGIPVTLQIRNTVNGYPGQYIVPFSEKVLNPSSVNVSSDGTVATSFVFDSPVYLQDGQEYCIVLLSNSTEYLVWTSNIGDFDVSTGERISEQPYAGSMFKSQNASTWTAAQEQDLKFVVHKCTFDISSANTLKFTNSVLPRILLQENPFTTVSGSNVVTVNHKNHGFVDGNTYTISGLTANQNGIPFAQLNGAHTITYIDMDTISFTTTSNATASGVCGGTTVTVSNAIKADTLNVIVENLVFTDTNISYSLLGKNSSGVYDITPTYFIPKENIELSESRYVSSVENVTDTESMTMTASMESDNPNISPVIDTERLSVIVVANRLNNLSTGETGNSGSAVCKYVTKKIELNDASTGLRVLFAANRPAGSDIKVYAKVMEDATLDNTQFDNLPYVEMTASVYPLADQTTFKDYTFELNELQPFSIYSIKVVMLGDNTALAPFITDFRTIALL